MTILKDRRKTDTRKLTTKLRDDLIDSIYALIDQQDGWPKTLQALQTLINQPSNHEPPIELASLFPHVKRVSKLIQDMESAQTNQHHHEQILNSIPIGMIFMQKDGRIISTNQRALELIKHIKVSLENQHMRFTEQKHQSAFTKAVQKVYNGLSNGESLKVGALTLWISKQGSNNKHLIIFLAEHTVHREICSESMKHVYGMTEQESRVACALTNGRASLEDTAEILHISINTARTHLKKIFAKTGAHNQAELIKIILLNPALTILRPKTLSTNQDFLLAKLPSGRSISYNEYGDPSGSPLIFCHSILNHPCNIPAQNDLFKHAHIRVIVPHRAGYGQSTPTNKTSLNQWVEDMRFFIPQVHALGCDVMGCSSGGAYAMALVSSHPSFTRTLHLVSSVVPIRHHKERNMLLPLNRMVAYLSTHKPTLALAFIQLALNTLCSKPEKLLEYIKAHFPVVDYGLVEKHHSDACLIKHFDHQTKCSREHIAKEILDISGAWDVYQERISCPVTIWHGEKDTHTPVELMQNFALTLPHCTLANWLPQSGHYLLPCHWPQILDKLKESQKQYI